MKQLLALALLFELTSQAYASTTVAFDNMPTNSYVSSVGGASYGPDYFYSGSPATLQGMQFTAAASGYLTSVFAPINSFIESQQINVELSLWSDSNTSPLTKLESSYLNVASTPEQILEWNWQGTHFLEQGTDYWIVAETQTAQSVLAWWYVPGYSSTTATRANKSIGDDWSIYLGNGGETAMRVLVTPVPEASTYALMLAGLGLVSVAVRRKIKWRIQG